MQLGQESIFGGSHVVPSSSHISVPPSVSEQSQPFVPQVVVLLRDRVGIEKQLAKPATKKDDVVEVGWWLRSWMFQSEQKQKEQQSRVV